jgi:NAD(P) transhydrogenase subunit alpha
MRTFALIALALAGLALSHPGLAQDLAPALAPEAHGEIDPFIFRLAIFVLAIFVGYYVVWSVTPALHTPLMSVTNAISSVIIVGALLALGNKDAAPISQGFGFFGVILAAINIFGGFTVTQRMLKMFRKD